MAYEDDFNTTQKSIYLFVYKDFWIHSFYLEKIFVGYNKQGRIKGGYDREKSLKNTEKYFAGNYYGKGQLD